ncbi:MAG: TonB family protein [Terracidiphilus sp.]|jgi:TonB family protein
MRQARYACALSALLAFGIHAQDLLLPVRRIHQMPDSDGVYYYGPDVTAPRLLSTVSVPYPDDLSANNIQGLTVLAMVIDANGIPENIQLLYRHGEEFDQAAIEAVKHSVFEPGRFAGKPVPVWIDVRVVFHANRSQALPQILIAERDLPPPGESQLEDKHHHQLSYTPPFPIHTVDADFADPFASHPYVQVAVVSVLVGEDGIPKDVRVVRGLGFGLDKKAEAAVWHYRFLPATSKGRIIPARREVMVSFVKF